MRLLIVLFIAAASGASAQAPDADPAVQRLLNGLEVDSLSCQEVYTLLATAQQQPERLLTLSAQPEIVIQRLMDYGCFGTPANPQTLYALSLKAYRDSNRTRGDSLFAHVIDSAASDSQRADFYYARGSSRYGSSSDFMRALKTDSTHAPSLYRRCGITAEQVGRPTTTQGRMAYWCMADCYRDVAERSDSDHISNAARRAAEQYEHAAPTPDQIEAIGLLSGDRVTLDLGNGLTCTTTVR